MRRRSEAKERHEADIRSREVVVPTDPVNEQVVIAAAIVDEEVRAKLVQRISPDYFLLEAHRAAWAGLRELAHRKLGYDAATLQRVAGDAVDVAYLGQLSELRPDVPGNLDFHVDALLWDKQRATAVTGPIASLIEAVRDPRSAPERVRALARTVGQSFDGHGGRTFLADPAELVRENMRALDRRIEGHACFPYGIPDLDLYEEDLDNVRRRRIIPGAAPGQVTVVTSVSGAGKTTVSGLLSLGLARQRRRVLYGAWEMQGGTTLELHACQSLGWSRTDLMEGRGFTVERRQEFEERQHAISKWVTYMRNPFRRHRGERGGNDRNLDVVQEHIADSGCEVFVADLWKRCLRDSEPDAEEDALLRQQAMAEEMGIHVILLQQQRLKDVEQRADKRPTREGIKGTSAWVDVADTILGMHRPALWKRIEDTKLEIFVLKQRYGKWPLGTEFEWDPDRGTLGAGRSIEYEQPGEQGGDFEKGFVAPSGGGRRRGGGGRRGRRRDED